MAGLLSKTTVVPVATGVRLGVDTECLLWGASPWERRPADNKLAKEKEPRYQGVNYPGTRALLIDWHLRRCRVTPIGCEGRDDRHDGGARGIKPAPKNQNGRDASEKSWHGAARRIYDAFSDGPLLTVHPRSDGEP